MIQRKQRIVFFLWKNTERRQQELYGFISSVDVCQPWACLNWEPGLRWVTPLSCEDSTCEGKQKKKLPLFVFPPLCSETITMAALSRRNMQSVGQLCLVTGSWTNHKLFICFYTLTKVAGGQILWSFMMTIWRAVGTCVCVFQHHSEALHFRPCSHEKCASRCDISLFFLLEIKLSHSFTDTATQWKNSD